MMPAAYVLDTHPLVWFLRGDVRRIGRAALAVLTDPSARLIVPSYVFEEMRRKTARGRKVNSEINIPPTVALRLLLNGANVRIYVSSMAAHAHELRLLGLPGCPELPSQDAPIAAVALAAQGSYGGPVRIITGDTELSRWAEGAGLAVVWDTPRDRRGVTTRGQ